MIGDMGVRVREEEAYSRCGKNEEEGGSRVGRPIIVEFKSEYDKWTVLRNKLDLWEMNMYTKFF